MQHIQLMAQSEYLCLERRLRAKPPEEHPPDQAEQVPHEHSSPDSDPQAKRTEFAVATAKKFTASRHFFPPWASPFNLGRGSRASQSLRLNNARLTDLFRGLRPTRDIDGRDYESLGWRLFCWHGAAWRA